MSMGNVVDHTISGISMISSCHSVSRAHPELACYFVTLSYEYLPS